MAIDEIRIGFDGIAKAGYWTTVAVRVRNGPSDWRGQLRLLTVDSDGIPVEYLDGRERTMAAHQSQWCFGYVKLGRPQCRITAELRNDQGRLAVAKTTTLTGVRAAQPAVESLLVTVGPSLGIEDALDRRRREERERTTAVRLDDGAGLPDRWQGYAAVNTLAIATSQKAVIDSLSDQQIEAIHQWVRMGGQLVLCAGRMGDELLGAEGRLRALAPGAVARVEVQLDTSNVESFVNSRQRLDAFVMTMLDNPRGVPLVSVRDDSGRRRPLIIRTPLGFGDIVFVAADLDQSPLADWSGRPGLVDGLLRLRTGRMTAQANGGNRLQYGYADISAQLRRALDQYRSTDGQLQVSNALFSVVVLLIVGYGLLVGPIDYWLLRGVFRKMQWTWLTFPLIVVGFSGLLVWMSVRLKGDQVRVNQVDVVDIDADSGLTRGIMLAHLFSPQATTFDLSLKPQPPAETELQDQVSLTWQGLPGASLGGLDSRMPPLFDVRYSVQDFDPQQPNIVGLPIPTAGSRGLVGQWSNQVALGPASHLSERNGKLEGELVNPLNAKLTDCVLMYANWAYRLDNVFAPGDRLPVAALARRDLEWRLTRRRVLQEAASSATSPWDHGEDDLARILEIMMFHGAAGGEAYTQLPHQYLGYLDMSRLLRSGRAVLLGRLDGLGSELSHDGKDLTSQATQHVVFCRVVLPVSEARQESTGDFRLNP